LIGIFGFALIGIVAFLVSGLTLFAGFGLGTMLLPVFALFFPVEVAVGATAVVHFANNLFKLYLLHRDMARDVVIRFGIPAVFAAFLGAWLLTLLADQQPVVTYALGKREAVVTPLKLVMGVLIVGFAWIDLLPIWDNMTAKSKLLPLGGILSGFFGGLSGHQGALRAAFIRPLRLEPTAFAATQTGLACLVDGARIVVYGTGFLTGHFGAFLGGAQWLAVAVGILAAFAGARVGKALLPKMTVSGLQWVTGGLLMLVGLGLASGLL